MTFNPSLKTKMVSAHVSILTSGQPHGAPLQWAQMPDYVPSFYSDLDANLPLNCYAESLFIDAREEAQHRIQLFSAAVV